MFKYDQVHAILYRYQTVGLKEEKMLKKQDLILNDNFGKTGQFYFVIIKDKANRTLLNSN